MSKQQHKDHVLLRRPKQVEDAVFTSKFNIPDNLPFGAKSSEFRAFVSRKPSSLEHMCSECGENRCISIPIPLFFSCFIVVAVGQFLVPVDESLRYIYWIGELVFSIAFGIFVCWCCSKRAYSWAPFIVSILMLGCSILGLLKSLNVVSWAWVWIFSPLFPVPIILLIWLIFLCRRPDDTIRT